MGRSRRRDAVLAAPLVPRARMPELDAVRGAAALLVVLYHLRQDGGDWVTRAFSAALRPGWLGVDVFFVLSGFLITRILLGTRERPDYYRDFFRRRFFRIVPL